MAFLCFLQMLFHVRSKQNQIQIDFPTKPIYAWHLDCFVTELIEWSSIDFFIFFLFAGDEMFSDSYKMKLIDDVIYEVYGKTITRKDDIRLDGANPSAEEADEGTDANVESGVDIVLNHRLAETYAFGDKKSFTLYLKDYMKK